MTDANFRSRRELREAERLVASAPEVEASIEVAADSQIEIQVELAVEPVVEAPAPIIELSRREIRELERAQQPAEVAAAVSNDYLSSLSLEEQLFVTDVRAAAVIEPQLPAEPVIPGAQPWSLTDTGSIFTFSPSVGTQPQGASMVIEPPADPLTITGSVTASGELILTGSITIPTASSSTAENSLVNEASRADLAMARDSFDSYISGIQPLSSAGVIKTHAKEKSFPVKVRRGQAQMYLVLTTALLMAAVAGLAIAAFMLGIFN